jgi:glycosyltransferase involved in cell wall biosynthesis
MVSIAVLIISYNNESGILRLVGEAAQYADQVIIIDNGSTDQTVPLLQSASRANDKVIALTDKDEWWPSVNKDWSPLAAARNFGLTQVTQEWVLVLDDDEYVSPDGFSHLRRLADASTCLAYFLPWNTYDSSGKTIIEDYKLSYFRSRKGIQYDGLFHENATKSVRRLQATCRTAPIEISHNPSSKMVRDKRKVYLEGLTSAVRVNPSCARLRWFLGLTFYHLGETADAHRHLIIAAELEDDRWHPIERINACFLLGVNREVTRNVQQRKRWFDRALQLCEDFENDVEMVAYGRVVDYIRKTHEIIERSGEAEDLYPSHLFYCF